MEGQRAPRRSLGDAVGGRRSRSAARCDLPSDGEDDNDDEREREQLRQEETRRRQQEIFGTTPRAPRRGLPRQTTVAPKHNVIGVSLSEIKNQWADVFQRATENKINVKNVWSIQSFDSLPVLARQLGDDGDFHTSGVAIESAAKVFSYRVDSLLLQSQQVQNAINRGDGKGLPTQGEDKEEGESAAKAKKRKIITNTLATEDELNMKTTGRDRQHLVDPLFAQTSSKFDQGGARGLLLLNCPIGPWIDIQLDSTAAQPQLHEDPVAEGEEPDGFEADNELTHAIAELCGEVQVTEPTPADQLNNVEAVVRERLGEEAKAEGAMPVDVDDDSDDGGCDLPQLDDAMLDEEHAAPDEMADDHGAGLADAGEDQEADKRLCAVDGLMGDPELGRPDDFHYFPQMAREQVEGGGSESEAEADQQLPAEKEALLDMHRGAGGTWQGPFDTARWKILRGHTTKEDQTSPKSKQKTKKPMAEIDFHVEVTDEAAMRRIDEDLEKGLRRATNPDALLLPRGRERKRDQSALPNFFDPAVFRQHMRKNKIPLPTDHHITTDYFFRLHCLAGSEEWSLRNKYSEGTSRNGKKQSVLKATLHETQYLPPEDGVAVGEFGVSADDVVVHEAPMDVDEKGDESDDGWHEGMFGMAADGDDDDDHLTDEMAASEAMVQLEGQAGIERVEAPEVVQQMQVQYARQAKVVDIKRLKDTMWQCLRVPVEGDDGETRSYTVRPTKLSHLVRKMQPLVASRRIASHPSEISIAFYFICLLHLCNENNLRIEQQDGMDDVTVSAA
eukprot:Sspe_Gene.65371::Locus_38705_Transcript_1_1_Confidence_1.000_Length_2423::g.65371::m.65371/K06676/BRRN1, BRN1, CAPH; condensin complex subunit 2